MRKFAWLRASIARLGIVVKKVSVGINRKILLLTPTVSYYLY